MVVLCIIAQMSCQDDFTGLDRLLVWQALPLTVTYVLKGVDVSSYVQLKCFKPFSADCSVSGLLFPNLRPTRVGS